MASEITYAEVKFKNESPTPVVRGLPEKEKPEQHPQKYPLWLPWLISLLLLLVCIALVVVLLGEYVQGYYKREVWGECWEKSRETMFYGCLVFV
ncbi:hypothetical protein RLOC_00000809 [Lonchura striata]|uniref:Uncharacterized protein n=1 Tax=Lonchura striata TaxID=40157 RepID=A0A218ULB1_9PASE|nr:hypothetical protein RLOC_00000809 [Lonchura striata domestica]